MGGRIRDPKFSEIEIVRDKLFGPEPETLGGASRLFVFPLHFETSVRIDSPETVEARTVSKTRNRDSVDGFKNGFFRSRVPHRPGSSVFSFSVR